MRDDIFHMTTQEIQVVKLVILDTSSLYNRILNKMLLSVFSMRKGEKFKDHRIRVKLQ